MTAVTESRASRNALTAIYAAHDEREAEVRSLEEEFAKAVAGDVTKRAHFARLTIDYAMFGNCVQKRAQTVAEVMHDTLDYQAFKTRAMAALARAAKTDPETAQLLADMGAAFADMEATS